MSANEDAREITWLVRRLFRAMAQFADAGLQDLGVSAADRAVMEFLYPDIELPVPEIAARYQVSRQHVQATVNRLLEAGYAVTAPNPRHKRSPLVRLTPSGKTLFRKIRSREARQLQAAFAGIKAADRSVTRATLAALLEHFKV